MQDLFRSDYGKLLLLSTVGLWKDWYCEKMNGEIMLHATGRVLITYCSYQHTVGTYSLGSGRI